MQAFAQMAETKKQFILRVRLTEKTLALFESKYRQFPLKSFQLRGRYSEVKFSFSSEHRVIEIILKKKYFITVSNQSKDYLMRIAKNFPSQLEQSCDAGRALEEVLLRKGYGCKVVDADLLGITLCKQFDVLGFNGVMEKKRVYFRFSPIELRKHVSITSRIKQCDQFFKVVVRTISGEMVDQNMPVPSIQEFYNSTRVSFVDQMYSSDCFKRRLHRFMVFYQPNCLFLGQVPIGHRFIEQFYQKCSNRCSFNSVRMKKMLFDFRFHRLERDKERGTEKLRQSGVVLVLNCPPDESRQIDNEIFESFELTSTSNQLQKFDKISQAFNKHVIKIMSEQKRQNFISLFHNKYLKIRNEVGFSQLLCFTSFFVDRLAFKRDTKEEVGIQSSTMLFRLPFSQKFRSNKYMYYFTIEIRSALNYEQMSQSRTSEELFENKLNKLLMYRENIKDIKENKDIKQKIQPFEFSLGNDSPLRGLQIYINQVLKKWNVRDCFYDLNSFVSSYMNVITDKTQEKNTKQFKNAKGWSSLNEGMSVLLQSLSRGFFMQGSAILLQILRIREKTRQEDSSGSDLEQNEQIMLLTLKLFKITSAGWIETIPSCLYYLEIQRDLILVYRHGMREEAVQISIKSSREIFERVIKKYMKTTLKNNVDIPQPHFVREA